MDSPQQFYRLRNKMVNRYYWFSLQGIKPKAESYTEKIILGFKSGVFTVSRFSGTTAADIMGLDTGHDLFSARFVEILRKHTPKAFHAYEVRTDDSVHLSDKVYFLDLNAVLPKANAGERNILKISDGAEVSLNHWSGQNIFGIQGTSWIIVDEPLAKDLKCMKNLELKPLQITR